MALAVVAGCTCAPGPPTPFESVRGGGRILFILLDLGSVPRCPRGFGCLSWATWTRGRWQFLSAVGRARYKMHSGWMAAEWQLDGSWMAGWGSSQVKGAGSWILHVCPPPPIPVSPALVCLHSPITLLLCVQGGGRRAIPRAVLPAMCLCLIRGHRRAKISFLLVVGLHFLNHFALSFVLCDGNNSTSSVGQDRCFPSRSYCPLSQTTFK